MPQEWGQAPNGFNPHPRAGVNKGQPRPKKEKRSFNPHPRAGVNEHLHHVAVVKPVSIPTPVRG